MKKSLILLVVFITMLSVSCITLKDDTDNHTEEHTEEIEKTIPQVEKLTLKLPDQEGNTVDLSEFAGKTIMVNFFATWCPPCNNELPIFEKYYNKYPDDLVIVLVNLNHQEKNKGTKPVMEWYHKGGYTMPIVFDLDGSKTSEYLKRIQGIPTTFLYNGEGELMVEPITGEMTEEMLDMIIELSQTK